jgi:hypothetical protein
MKIVKYYITLQSAVMIGIIGGTAEAQAKLIDLKPRERLKNYDVFSIVKAEGG